MWLRFSSDFYNFFVILSYLLLYCLSKTIAQVKHYFVYNFSYIYYLPSMIVIVIRKNYLLVEIKLDKLINDVHGIQLQTGMYDGV